MSALAEALSWADARFGPMHDVRDIRLTGPDPSWWVCASRLARAGSGWFGAMPGAAGASTDPVEARNRMIGEFLERHSALNAPIHGEPRIPALPLPRCAPDEPCPESYKRFDPATPLIHVRMERLSDGAGTWVPAGFVHLGYWPEPPEPPVVSPISTGLAFHSELAPAIWAGLCEVAERDALMTTWWTRRPVPEIVCSEVPEPLADRLDRIAAVRLVARFFDITTDFLAPAVLCVLTGTGHPRLVVGAACRADPLSACTKALDEAVSGRVALRGGDAFRPPAGDDFGWVRRLEDHSLLYARTGAASAFDFLSAGQPQTFADFAARPHPAEPGTLGALRAFAAERDWTILWTDVTTPDVVPFGHVVKVVVPEMVPLSETHQVRWLATPRLLRAAGVDTPSVAAFHPYPHPFA